MSKESTKMRAMDMVTVNIIDSTMVSICREMGVSLMKTSYSTIFNEGLDFTCALADNRGDMIACAEFCPTIIGGMPLLIKTCAQEIPFDTLDEGDVIVHNDPYRGGLHVPEHTFFKPFFVDGELLGFAVCIGHIAEIGGMVPGAFAGEATEIFHEGIRLPPLLLVEGGVVREDLWQLLLLNCRTPDLLDGDLRAMLGSTRIGAEHVEKLAAKIGVLDLELYLEGILAHAERSFRSAIAELPDGVYEACETTHGDCFEDGEFEIRVTLTVDGDSMHVDFTGSAGQLRGFAQRCPE